MSPTAREPDVVLRLEHDGSRAREVRLDHGVDPAELVAAQGLRVLSPVCARYAAPHCLMISLAVVPAAEPVAGGTVRPPVGRDADVRERDIAEAVRRRRIAAYALVRRPGPTTEDDLVLLTVLSDRVRAAPGLWTMPGGGLDEGEDPAAACVREVWEETGQEVVDLRLVGLTSDHWVGRAPNGVLEDFQPIRLLYRATCPRPTEPVVHDIGGTTASAAWVPVREVCAPGFPLVRSWRAVVPDALRNW